MKYEENISLKYRIFNVVFLVGIFMSFSCSLMNYFLGFNKVAVLLSFICGVITVVLFVVFKISKNYELVSLIVVIFLSFVFFPIMWLITGGTYTSIPYYIITNAGIIVLLLTGLQRKIIVSLFALFVGGLMVTEYLRPELVVRYDSVFIRYVDIAFGLFVCLFSIAVLISVLIDSYMDELQKSKQYLATLEEKNRELKLRTDYWKKVMLKL
ncbi:MAG: hypothetical protein GX197_06640 [Firmicutes bacterium]|nr:hypothetical protein [Bacillota bacterium]